MTRDRIIKWLPVAALSIGPCAAYLVWAITRRRWFHVVIAAVLNLLLWTVGPISIIYVGTHL